MYQELIDVTRSMISVSFHVMSVPGRTLRIRYTLQSVLCLLVCVLMIDDNTTHELLLSYLPKFYYRYGVYIVNDVRSVARSVKCR